MCLQCLGWMQSTSDGRTRVAIRLGLTSLSVLPPSPSSSSKSSSSALSSSPSPSSGPEWPLGWDWHTPPLSGISHPLQIWLGKFQINTKLYHWKGIYRLSNIFWRYLWLFCFFVARIKCSECRGESNKRHNETQHRQCRIKISCNITTYVAQNIHVFHLHHIHMFYI